MIWTTSHRLLLVGLAAIAAGALTVSGASAPRATGAGVTVRPRTLATTHHEVLAFAQDAGRIAWISGLRLPRGRVGCGLRIRQLAAGRTSTIRLNPRVCEAEEVDELALADRTAAWTPFHSCGNTECWWTIASATAGDRRARVVEGTSGLSCFSGICSSELDPQPLLAGAGRLLAYSNGQGRVERIRGNRVRRLFRTGGAVYGLAVGGGRVATVSLSLLQGDGSGRLGVPAWSPDGSKIAYLDGTFYTSEPDIDAAVAVMNAEGSDRHHITASQSLGSWPTSLSWSPDGTKIAYDATGGQIDVANADGSGSSQLVAGYSPAWSPDGSTIAFVRIDYSSNSGGIYVTDPDGTNTRQLMSGPADIRDPAWSPDGTRIAFSLEGLLEVMTAGGTGVHQLGSAAAGDDPAWSPDGSRIVFHTQSGLSVIGADGSGLHQLTGGPDAYPSWSPDGKTIVFASFRDDPYLDAHIYNDSEYLELYLVDPDGSNLRPLSFTRPSEWVNTVTVRSSGGKLVSRLPAVPRSVTSVAFAGNVATVARVLAGGVDQLTLFAARSGAELATMQVGTNRDFRVVGGDAHWVVFRLGQTISALDLHSHEVTRLAFAAAKPLGLSVSGRRVAWAENIHGHGRIRSLQLPS